MSLAICTPTRNRLESLLEQAAAIAPQLADGDLWIIGTDRWGNESVQDKVHRIVPRERVAWLSFDYRHDSNVNRLRNALAAFAPPTHDIVELDDHDPLVAYALSEIRQAFTAGHEYVFGWHDTRALIDLPEGGQDFWPWPTVQRAYDPGDFAAGKIDAIAVHGVRRALWDKLGGWDATFPGGDKSFAIRAEAAGAKIICLQLPLCCVTVDPSGICGQFHPVM